MNRGNFFAELKRRNVYKVAVAYAVVGWLVIQVTATIVPALHLPDSLTTVVVVLTLVGFPVALVIAWAFEMTPQGMKRTEDISPDVAATLPTWSRRKFATFFVTIAVIAGGLLAYQLLRPKSNVAPPQNASAARTEAATKSIAVLPFMNMSADKNDEYLSDGMTEELLTVLSKVKGLRVPGRSSCFAFKGKNEEDIFRKVGAQLHVNTVLEGSVRKAGDKLRITAQLIDVADGYHLWSETYDGEMKDILSVESDVAQRVVEALKIKLGVDQARLLTKKATENPEAHRLYLLGRYYFAKGGTAGWTRAMQYFNQAIQLDPNYALAYCGLADIYSYMGGFTMLGREAWAKEKELAQKALALDPDLAEAHLSLGEALVGAFQWREGENEIKRALELNPNLALAYDADAWVLAITGRFDEAIAQARKTSQLDPLNPGSFGFYLYLARRYDEAMAELRRDLELVGDNASGHSVLGWCLIAKGDAAGAIAEQEKAKALDDLPIYDGCLGYSYGILGDRAKAEQVLTHLNELAKQRYVSPQALITVYIGLGEKNTALDWLEKSYEDQDIACWYLKVDPVYDSLRNEPRFQALVQKIDRTKAESKK